MWSSRLTTALLSFAILLTVAPNLTAQGPLRIQTNSLPLAISGTVYSFTMDGTGGKPPYTWTASGLPSGLSMLTGGQIAGTPSALGTFSVMVTLRDSEQTTVSKTL